MTEPELEVIWDPVKARANIAKHGVTFAQAATVLLDPLALTVFDAAHSEVEDRWFTLGMSSAGKLLAVAHTYQPLGPARFRARLISAREATRRERVQYENEAP
ncbi:MAG TPA: BrnT family toxin [Xanthomonadaceae bacterium]|nr:BrnT family toxin [Xanthomonadaceae bacterium]